MRVMSRRGLRSLSNLSSLRREAAEDRCTTWTDGFVPTRVFRGVGRLRILGGYRRDLREHHQIPPVQSRRVRLVGYPMSGFIAGICEAFATIAIWITAGILAYSILAAHNTQPLIQQQLEVIEWDRN